MPEHYSNLSPYQEQTIQGIYPDSDLGRINFIGEDIMSDRILRERALKAYRDRIRRLKQRQAEKKALKAEQGSEWNMRRGELQFGIDRARNRARDIQRQIDREKDRLRGEESDRILKDDLDRRLKRGKYAPRISGQEKLRQIKRERDILLQKALERERAEKAGAGAMSPQGGMSFGPPPPGYNIRGGFTPAPIMIPEENKRGTLQILDNISRLLGVGKYAGP